LNVQTIHYSLIEQLLTSLKVDRMATSHLCWTCTLSHYQQKKN